jgi:oligoribonuclease (3'-5' exoribonuclease)
VKPKAIVWLDAETTGLGKKKAPTLLELALVVTGPDLVERSRESVVLRHEPAELARIEWDQAAWDMHEANGLRLECSGPDAVSPWVAERRLLEALANGLGVSLAALEGWSHAEGSSHEDAPVWGGCSPHLDRLVVRNELPALYAAIHYRTLDAVALRMALELWHGLSIGSKEGPKLHRALPDALRAVELASEYRRLLHLVAPDAPLVHDELVRASA